MISSPRFAILHPLTAMIVSLLLVATPRPAMTPPQGGDCVVDVSYPQYLGCDAYWDLEAQVPPGTIRYFGESYARGACSFSYTDCNCDLINAQTQHPTEQMTAYPLFQCYEAHYCTTWEADFTVYGYYWSQGGCSMNDECPNGYGPPVAIQEVDGSGGGEFNIINDPSC